MTKITLYDGKVYEGSAWQGKINGVKISELEPMDAPYVLIASGYGCDCMLRANGEWSSIGKLPEENRVADGEYALTNDEYAALVAAINAPKPVATPDPAAGQRSSANKPCPRCGTYCHGDCTASR